MVEPAARVGGPDSGLKLGPRGGKALYDSTYVDHWDNTGRETTFRRLKDIERFRLEGQL
jgi:hypothetical protein